MSTRIKPFVPLSALVAVALLAACETTTAKSTSRTVERDPATGESVVVEEKVSTEQEIDTCDGVLSCTFDFAGEVIAFPFRLVGGLFTAIF